MLLKNIFLGFLNAIYVLSYAFVSYVCIRFNMNHGKSIVPDSSGPIREFTKWTADMDFRLLSTMIDEARLGNRVDGSWTTQAYTNIVEALRQSGLLGLTKNNVKNRQKSLKDTWREVHDLFNGLSGFAWNNSTKIFEAEHEVWDDLIKVNNSPLAF